MKDVSKFAQLLPPPARAALFIDFDGTLVDLAETPDGIAVTSDLPDLLDLLGRATDGALALVSGRSVDAIAGFLPDFGGVIVGGHGAETRINGETVRHPFAGSETLTRLISEVRAMADEDPGLIAEEKPTGIVLHYRKVPRLELWVQEWMSAFADSAEGVEAHQAKMAVELRPDDIGKDRAVDALLRQAPFEGRTAFFCGDDATDEPAMALCLERGGSAVKVGDGETGAPLHASDPSMMRALLAAWARGDLRA